MPPHQQRSTVATSAPPGQEHPRRLTFAWQQLAGTTIMPGWGVCEASPTACRPPAFTSSVPCACEFNRCEVRPMCLCVCVCVCAL